MNIIKILFVYLFTIILSHAESDLDLAMISALVHGHRRPTSILATLCWPLHKKRHLYNVLAGTDVARINMLQFLKPDVTPRDGIDEHTLFLVDNQCPNVTGYFELSNTKRQFRSPFRWLIINYEGNEQHHVVPDTMAHLSILPDSEVKIANLKNDTFYLDLVYRITPGGEWHVNRYGTWNQSAGLRISRESGDALILERLHLKGLEIPIAYVLTNNQSVEHLNDRIDDHIDTITKANFLTSNHLLDFLNASRRYVFVNTWGYRVNGTWNGMTELLVREEVEIGGSPMFFTSERLSVVDYVSSPTPTRSKFVFQQPKLSYENNLFLLSFRTSVWYSSMALIFLLFLGLFIASVWEWKKNDHILLERSKDDRILRPNPYDVALLIVGATCQQGSTVELKGSLGRVVMLILFLALTFLYTSYSANIVALLQSSSSQIKTLEDLLHSRLKFGVDDTVFNKYYFSTATEPTRKAIYQSKVAPPGAQPRFMSMEEGVKRMKKGLFAFHMETGVGYKFVGKYFQESEKCGLKEIQYLQVIDPWLAVRKDTPYKEMFKLGLKRIQEHGLQNRENLIFYRKLPKCSGRGGNFVSVSMVDCYPALLVLTYGLIIALGVFCGEILMKKRQEILKKLT